MLQRIRDNASGPLAYVVVAVIALVFGVWGIGSYFTPSADPVVASVGSTDITRYQLRNAYEQRYQRLRQIMGDNFDPSLVPPDKLRRSVLQGMINDAVINQYASQAGYRVTDAGLLAAIRGNPQFQVDGKFSAQRYRALLAQAGIPAARYESGLRHDLKSRQLHGEIANSAFAAPAEVDQAYQLANQQRQLRYLTFDPAHYRDRVSVSDADIKSYYDAHPKRFERPARVKLAYVELNRANVEPAKAPDEKTLRTLYDQNKAQLGTPEKRSASQIRVPIDGDDSAARETIQQLAKVVGSGEDFQAAMQSASAKADFSHIDSATRKDLPPAVADTLFDLDKGETSSPVHADKAWYLLRLGAITPAMTPDFDDPQVQAELKAMASSRQASKTYQDKADRLESLAYEAPNDLKTLTDDLQLDVQHTDWITRQKGSGLGQYDAVRKAAFSDAVYKDKLNSTPIQLGADRRVVLRVDKRQAAKRRPLDQVRDQIRQRLVESRASQQARDAATQALDTLKSGGSLQALATGGGPSLQSPGYIGRSNRDVDPRIREAAFSLARPDKGKPSYEVTATQDGKIALLAVADVRAGDNGAASEKQAPRQQFADQQRNYVANLEYAAFNAYLRDDADIQISEDRVD